MEGNSTGLVDIVYAARNQEVQWYRELRAAAAAKRRERENESAKEPSPLKANAEIIVGAIEENAPARDVVNGDVEILDGSSTAAVKSDRRDTGVIKEVTENQDGTATNPLTAISLPPPPPGSTDAVEKKPESDSFDPTMLKFSIFTLELSEKTKNALELHTQLRTIEDLLRTSSTELSKVPGIGPKTLAEIRDGLVTLHYPLGILFDAVDKLPIKGTSIASIIRRIERPHPRCFELLFHSFEAFEAAGVSASDIRMIYEVFKKSGFDFRIK